MRVTVEFAATLKVEGVESGGTVDLEEGATVQTLLDRLGLEPHHHPYVVPLVNRSKVRFGHVLGDGDHVYLLLPVGGG